MNVLFRRATLAVTGLAAVALAAAPSALPEGGSTASPARFESFVLETHDASGKVHVVGTLRLGESLAGEKHILESETRFVRESRDAGIVHLFEVEELRPVDALLTWREVAAGSGRSVTAEWSIASNGLEVRESGSGESVRERQISVEGALFPLYLLHLARSGRIASGSVPVFDPLARTIEHVAVHTSYEWQGAPAGRDGADERTRVRCVTIERDDGTTWARYRFTGTRLVGVAWQLGGAEARVVDEAEYARANAGLEPRPLRESVPLRVDDPAR